MTETNCSSHCWRLHIDKEADRKERGRQKDVASASRLSSNWWFVVFSERTWVWLMCTCPQSRQTENIQSHRTFFFFLLQSSDFWQEFGLCIVKWSSTILHLFMWTSSFMQHGIIISSVMPSPLLTLWTWTFTERTVRKGAIVWFLSFPLWTKTYKHKAWATEKLVNTHTHTQTFKALSCSPEFIWVLSQIRGCQDK